MQKTKCISKTGEIRNFYIKQPDNFYYLIGYFDPKTKEYWQPFTRRWAVVAVSFFGRINKYLIKKITLIGNKL